MQYSKAQIYNAIMEAADHIERNPQSYDFHSEFVGECGPACMWGWIGRMLGIDDRTNNMRVAESIGFECTGELYGIIKADSTKAEGAAKKMRKFANQYFCPTHEPATQSFNEIMDDLKTPANQGEL